VLIQFRFRWRQPDTVESAFAPYVARALKALPVHAIGQALGHLLHDLEAINQGRCADLHFA
jgi:hypothetical protein